MEQIMRYLECLPPEVRHVIRSQLVVQYATVSAAGVPIDTPTGVFTSEDLRTLDIATGLAYPAKAERARNNPKVGLLIEKGENEPVVSIAGLASVRDSDLQANLDRYMAESALVTGKTAMNDWSVVREANWYYARIFVCITPVRVRWWLNRSAMDEQPQSWRMPPGAIQNRSDPAPAGKASTPPAWPQRPWAELARIALERNVPCHLTLLDCDGFPLPMGARDAQVTDEGFLLTVPAGAPWQEGKATLSFQGVETFVGSAVTGEGQTRLLVERALPVLPLSADPSEVLRPKADTRAALMKRLEWEAARRGQPIPSMPNEPPRPTTGALYRAGTLCNEASGDVHIENM
jgi:hypothetical protein